MFEITENTQSRLVIAIRQWFSSTIYSFDATTRMAQFKRKVFGVARKPLEIAFDDIAAIDAVTTKARRSANHAIILRLKSGERRWMDADNAQNAEEAAARMRTFIGLPEPSAEQAAEALPRPFRWWQTGLAVAGVIVAALIGISEIIERHSLPKCDSSRALKVITDIWQKEIPDPVTVNEATEISRRKGEYRCSARVSTTDENVLAGYHIYWDNKDPVVQVTGLIGTRQIDPELFGKVQAAADSFHILAKQSYVTGDAPEQSDASVDALLSTIFDVPDSQDEQPLAPADIDTAIEWFNIGDAVGGVYVVAGTGVDDSSKIPATEEMQRRMQANVVRFAPEFGRYVDFQMKIQRLLADGLTAQIATDPFDIVDNPEFKARAENIRSVFAETIGTNFIAMTYPGHDDDWRQQRLAVLNEIAPSAARLLKGPHAQAVREQVLKTEPYFQNPDIRAAVKNFADTIHQP